MATRGRRSTSSRKQEKSQEDMINELLLLAKAHDLEPPEQKKPFAALRKIAGILNTGTAIVAGGVHGILDEDTSVVRGMYEGFKKRETYGFSDVIREDLGWDPQTRAGKIGLGTVGLAADILFDPLTYLTLGVSATSKVAKVGGKTLTKGGTEIAARTASNLIKNRTAQYLEKGLALETAERLAQKKVSGITNELLMRTTGKKGLTDEVVRDFVEKGVEEADILALQSAGKTLIDQGGIKMFGHTLVSSKAIANTRLGQAAKALGETEIAQTLKTSLGNTFVADFNKNKQLSEIVSKAGRAQQRAMQGIVEANSELFKGLNDEQMTSFFTEVFNKKKEVIKIADDVETDAFKKLQELFPQTKAIETREQALKALDNIEGDLSDRMVKLQKIQDEITQPFFEARQAARKAGELVEESTDTLSKVPAFKSLQNVDELNDAIEAARKALSKIKTTVKQQPLRLAQGASTSGIDDAIQVFNKSVIDQEDKLTEKLTSLLDRIEVKKAKAASGEATGTARVAGEAPEVPLVDQLKGVQDEMLRLQNETTKKARLLEQVVDARRIAKKRLKEDRLYFDDPMLQKVSDTLFEGDDAITARFARLAGISEQDAIKFYIPSKFNDRMAVKSFLMGRNLTSPNLGFRKKFTGVEENLIRNPFEAFSRGQIEVVTGRIKSDAFRTATKKLGRPIEDLAEKEAKALGYERVARTGFDGNKIEAWFPKEVADELKNFLEPKANRIDDLAKSLGFDWATGLFKAYVTSLFPGFHVRNITSNQFQNMIKVGVDVANPAMQKRALDVVLGKNLDSVLHLKNGKTMTLGELRNMVSKESDILESTGPFGRIEQMLDTADPIKQTSVAKKNFNPFSRENTILEKARKFGSNAESQAKMVTIISSVVNGQTVKQGIENAEEVLFNYSKLTGFEKSIMRRLIPFYTFCVPDYSEILTQDGWKKYDELSVGEIVLTYNKENDCYEWQPVEAVNTFEYDDNLLSFSNTRHTIEFTPDHSWVVKTPEMTVKRPYGTYHYDSKIKTVKGYELNKNHNIKMVSSLPDSDESLLTPKQAALLGWLLTDGHFRWRGEYCEATLYQTTHKWTYRYAVEAAGNEPRYVREDCNLAYIPVRKDLIEPLKQYLKRNKKTDSWVDIVTRLSKEAAQAMYDAMYMADGTTTPNRTQDYFACETKPGVGETFQVLATLLGKRCVKGTKGYYVSDFDSIKISCLKQEKKKYNGVVWCPTTTNGTWVMRQDKLITITGNSRKNFELQLKTLMHKPGFVANELKAVRGVGNMVGENITEDDIEGLPSYVLESLGIKAGAMLKDEYGRDTFITGFGLPIEEFMQRFSGEDSFAWNLFKTTLEQTNPIIKYPTEHVTGQDFFRGRPIAELSNAKDLVQMMELMPGPVRKQFEDWIDFKKIEGGQAVYVNGKKVGTEDKYTADPFKLHFVRNLPTSRIVSTVGFVGDESEAPLNRALRFLTGVRGYSIDEEQQKFFNDLERKRELEDWLIRMGVGKKFETFYDPTASETKKSTRSSRGGRR